MPFVEAEKLGAEMEFGQSILKLFQFILSKMKMVIRSQKSFVEVLTFLILVELGKFKIVKEEAVASGIRRIKAILNKIF